MKFSLLVSMLMGTAFLVSAAELTGFLADAKCGAAGRGGSESHAECAKKCAGGGQDLVLVTADGKVYKIKNQDKVKDHAGAKATLTGKVDGDTIEVERGRKAE